MVSFRSWRGAGLSLLVALIAACGDGGGKTGSTELPSELAAGTTLSINPTLTIVDGTHFSYQNVDADSKFTASISNGTYSYQQSGDAATLTLMGEGAGDGKLLDDLPQTLSLSLNEDGQLDVEIGGETYQGTLEVPGEEDDGDDQGPAEEVKGVLPTGAVPGVVNAAFVGKHELAFGNPQPGAPFEAGTMATFVVGSDNTLTIMGKQITNPYELNGNKGEIIWNDGEYSWALSDNERGTFNEINLQKASDNTWLGQWADPAKFAGGDSESDANKEVTLTVESSGGPQGLTVPLSSGSVTLIWDGKEGLTFKIGDGVYSSAEKFVGEEAKDGNRVLKWTSSRGEIQGIEHYLTVDSADKILRYREVSWKGEPSNRVEAFAEAVP